MADCKTSMASVTNEEIERASLFWQVGDPFKIVAYKVGWSETLFWRVYQLCQEFDDPENQHFPRRNKCGASLEVKVSDSLDREIVEAAKKPRQISRAQWQSALSRDGVKPSTVAARRPTDYLAKRKLVDPTLSLPERRA